MERKLFLQIFLYHTVSSSGRRIRCVLPQCEIRYKRCNSGSIFSLTPDARYYQSNTSFFFALSSKAGSAAATVVFCRMKSLPAFVGSAKGVNTKPEGGKEANTTKNTRYLLCWLPSHAKQYTFLWIGRDIFLCSTNRQETRAKHFFFFMSYFLV